MGSHSALRYFIPYLPYRSEGLRTLWPVDPTRSDRGGLPIGPAMSLSVGETGLWKSLRMFQRIRVSCEQGHVAIQETPPFPATCDAVPACSAGMPGRRSSRHAFHGMAHGATPCPFRSFARLAWELGRPLVASKTQTARGPWSLHAPSLDWCVLQSLILMIPLIPHAAQYRPPRAPPSVPQSSNQPGTSSARCHSHPRLNRVRGYSASKFRHQCAEERSDCRVHGMRSSHLDEMQMADGWAVDDWGRTA